MKLALFACVATLLCCFLFITLGQAQQPVSDVDQLLSTETATDSVTIESPSPTKTNKTIRYIRMKRNLTRALSVVKAMDLYKVEARLVKELNWTSTYATEVVNEYKRFLVLGFMKTGGWSLVPSVHVDEAWHAHILHTRMYMKDCNKLFGHYFHHNPADPAPPQQKDNANNTTAPASNKHQQDEFKQGFAATLAAYRQLFGEPGRAWLPASCSGCNGQCSGEKKAAGCGHGCGGDKKAAAGCGHGCGGDKKAAAGCGHGCGGDATAGCGHGCGGDKKAGCGHGCGGDKDAAAGCGHGCGGDKDAAAGCGSGCGGDKDAAAGCGSGCGGDKDAAAGCGGGCSGGCKGDKNEGVEGSCSGGCSGGCKGDKHEGVEGSCSSGCNGGCKGDN